MPIGIGDELEHLHRTVVRWATERGVAAAARQALEAADDALPPFWPDLAAQGWCGLHATETVGGQGFGLSALVVVVEALAGSAAPGPFLPTVLAVAVLQRAATAAAAPAGAAGGDAAAALGRLLSGLVGGGAAAVVLPGAGALRPTTEAGAVPEAGGPVGVQVAGTVQPVLGAGTADVVVAPLVDGAAGTGWVAVPVRQSTVTVAPLPSLDPTRRLGAVTIDGADALLLPGIDDSVVVALARALVAAECAGGTRWCTETAAEHARTRHQFGRPIGQFQAVKHKVADMLVTTEAVTALAWDAARALDAAGADPGGTDAGGDGGGTGAAGGDAGTADQGALSAAAAAAVALDGYARCAKDCIQVLGGMGFTWEHDAHLHLRRAVSLAQLLDPLAARLDVAARAVGGTRRRPDTELPPEAEAARAAVAPLVAEVAAAPREERRRQLVAHGLVAPHWPPPHGRGAGPVEQVVIDQELAAAGVRRPTLAVGAWALPTIIAHGTEAQQARWVAPTLHGEITWCQLFSEPGAGSDLASLRTRATRVDGGWRLEGQKVWTSLAAQADFGICLARTDPAAPRHEGITYFVVDMRAEGIDVRPLRELTGDALFNEVFLDGVFVPDADVVGPVGGGWALARTTLANERVQMSSGATFGAGVEALLGLWRDRAGAPAGDATPGHGSADPAADLRLGALADRVGALVAEAAAVAVLGERSTRRALSGVEPGAEASVRKLLGAEHEQRVHELGLALLGPGGAVAAGDGARWGHGLLVTRCLTIAGGTSEVQRNVIAERLLDLPRDPEPPAGRPAAG